LADLKRSLYYYHQSTSSEKTDNDVELIKKVSRDFKLIGNKKIAAVIKRDHSRVINHKRIERLRRENKLIPLVKKKHRFRLGIEALPIPEVTKKNEVWAIDFMSSRKGSPFKYRLFNVIDVHSKIAPVMGTKQRMSSEDVVAYLEDAIKSHGKPLGILSDNGSEFRSELYVSWCKSQEINIYFTAPGKPVQNCYIESFNSCVRRELLNDVKAANLESLCLIVENWRSYYNQSRPHGSLDYMAPMEYVS
jgi:putative transposase